jgi:hypothetical protein
LGIVRWGILVKFNHESGDETMIIRGANTFHVTPESYRDNSWPDNIVADRHEITKKWVLYYLTDEQAKICHDALLQSPNKSLEEK